MDWVRQLTELVAREAAPKPLGTKSVRKDGTTYQKTKKGWQYVGKGSSSSSSGEPKKPQKASPVPSAWKGFTKPPPGKQYKPGDLAPISPSIKWSKPKKPRAPRSSADKHKGRDGRYKPERRKLHRQILSGYLEAVKSVPEGKAPMTLMMMGSPGTGKSSLTKGVKDTEFVKVDADALKEALPEYQEMVAKGNTDAASYVHAESGFLASKLRDLARAQRKNMVLDGTGRYADSYKRRMQELQKDGYHVQLMMPHVSDVETLVERAKKRAAQTGRHVPEAFIRKTYDQIQGNFMGLAKGADSATLYDNSGDKPRMVWTRHKGGEVALDKEFVSEFQKKHGGGERESVDGVERLRSLLRESVPLALDPEELAKSLEGVELVSEDPEVFTPDQGLTLPDPDDVAFGDLD